MTRLRIARLCRGWSLSELARRSRTTKTDLSRWERCLDEPYPAARRRLAQVMQLRGEALLEDIPDDVAAATVEDVRVHRRFRDALQIHPDSLVSRLDFEAARDLVRRWGGWSLPTLDQFENLRGRSDRAWRRAAARSKV